MSPLSIDVLLACALALLLRRFWPGEAGSDRERWSLIAASIVVLAYWQPLGLAVTLALVGITWWTIRGARAADPARARRAVTAGITLLVIALAAGKYTPWLLGLLPAGSAWAASAWIVPLGISFTVFRLIGAILDARSLRTQTSGSDILFLALFFPTYRSGPIETVRSLRPLAADEQRERDLGWAVRRVLIGLGRKVILADTLNGLVISHWEAAGIAALAPAKCFVLPILYGLYVYWDFSGYTDIAIGTGALLGYRVSENFNRPYLSRNMSEFWRRWHITLSEWIRLRLFVKMVGRRAARWQLQAATLASMALCGLWHGAGWNFIAWGVWHGVGLVAVQLFADAQRRSAAVRRLATLPGATAVSVGLTFAWVSAGWALFFQPLGTAWRLFTRALGCPPLTALAIVTATAGGLVAYEVTQRAVLRRSWELAPAFVRGFAYAVLVFGIILGAAEPSANFIYFAF
jgi:alginate O-acetyltransferase complex protein AlgI